MKKHKERGSYEPPKMGVLRKMSQTLAFLLIAGCLSIGTAFAQNKITVSGVVSDSEGPVIGASVVEKGNPKNGVSTDFDGKYSLSVPANATLEFTYLGYTSQSVAVGGKTSINILLVESANTLDEVVVTGMVAMDKRLFTGATDKLKAEDMKIGGVSEFSRSLEGRSAGVSVQNVSGTFGTAPKIKVRGATSIYGSSKPLWVVDGVIMEDVTEVSADDLSSGDINTLVSSSIAGLNSSDIEDVQILKDGSATSIYGAKAMAGVIVVTTKKGKSGTSQISYTGEFTSRLIPSYNNFNIMNSQDQMSVYQELEQKGWLPYTILNGKNSGVYGKMYQQINTFDPKKQAFLMPNTEAARNAYLRDAEYRNTDWFDELFSTSIVQNHSLSISGGTEKTNFYGSVSAMLDPGWTIASSVKRYTGNMNINHRINDKLSANIIMKAYNRAQKAPGTQKRSIDSVSGEISRDFDNNPYSYALRTSRTMAADEYYTLNYAPFNIKHELENNYMDLNESSTTFQAELIWTPIKGLNIKALGALKNTSSTMEHIIKDEANQAEAYRAMGTSVIANANGLLWKDLDKTYSLPVSILPEGGIYERTDNRLSGWDFRASANYTTTFNDIHIVNLFAGTEFNSVDRFNDWNRQWGRQYNNGDVGYIDYHAFRQWQAQGESQNYYTIKNTRRRDASFFAMANYSYKGKYTINGTTRYEGSNQMGKSRKSRWLPTWNLSGAWNMHEENFFEAWKSWMSHATWRVSYSLTAQAPPLSVSNSAIIYASANTWRLDEDTNEPAITISQLENSELTYEKKHELNVGVDLGFLDNRINLSADWYTRNNYDLIGNIAVMGVGGQPRKRGNVAAMKTSGVEATLSTKNIRTEDFAWTTDFTFSKMHVEVTKLESRSRIIDLITGTGFAKEGYSNRTLFSIPFAGLDENGVPQFYMDKEHTQITQDMSNKGIYLQDYDNQEFLIESGSTDPTLSGGFGNTLRYKNFKLNLFLTYSFGNVVRLDPVFHSGYSDMTAMPKEFANRWVLAGDEKYTDIPVILDYRTNASSSNYRYIYTAYNYSDARTADGGFIRLKDISLSYDFNKELVQKWHLKSLGLKLQATNLCLLYADKKLNGQDPEFANAGGVATPMPKQFTFTVMLGL
ncbi:MAG: SusC/RagA family TonB-linked outer membrane protein [Candidatus Symbiothrix sp.]|jgi:TonB-linked SusC/RagA family outer membrane protein|nr:SusC/RagA family TonB-linked outer membrane protein [Candidatus Symbiothrix sp.]